MLSYRHVFHAGGFADVIKHVVMVEILEHLTRKTSPFVYIDTHSGAGLYDLRSEQAARLEEYRRGIAKLNVKAFPELRTYLDIVRKHNPEERLDYYPGSPLIASHFLRDGDRSWLYELHPTDFTLLQARFADNDRVRVMHDDGFRQLASLLPPVSRRGLVLIDPPYEVKNDYSRVYETIARAWRKFSSGIYALWYPVVERVRIEELERKFISGGIGRIQLYELGISGDAPGRGLSAAGMIVVNPPWMLLEKMSVLLPRLAAVLGPGNRAFFRSEVLVPE